MNVLIVGFGKGSFEMRAVQLGAAMGARVRQDPSAEDYAWADLIVLLKRAIATPARAVATGKPIVWDAVDFWSQPTQHHFDRGSAIAFAKYYSKAANPALTIGATQAMAADLGGVYLPHHGRIGLTPTAARPQVQTVGYDGNPLYLDRWQKILVDACERRGWRFVVNPSDLSTVDILVALRGGIWDGWICRQWKSGVKLANAILAGRPVLTQDTAAFHDILPSGTVVSDADSLDEALTYWSDYDRRQDVVDYARTRAARFTVEAVAERYRAILSTVAQKAGSPC